MNVPVVLALDPGHHSAMAARWAAQEAAARGTYMHVVGPPGCGTRHRHGLAGALATARALAPDLTVTVEPTCTSPASWRDMALVVTPALNGMAEAAMAAGCPCAVVSAAGRRGGPVMAGVGPEAGSEVLAFALDQAARRHARLRIVSTGTVPQIDVELLLPGAIERWAAADGAGRRDLTDSLTAFAQACPMPSSDRAAVDDAGVEVLCVLGSRARLLVLGRPASGPATAQALAVAGRAPCPVVLVPSPIPARTGAAGAAAARSSPTQAVRAR